MDADNNVEILTRANSLPLFRSPTGISYKIVKDTVYPFFKIKNDPPNGPVPEPLEGFFTKERVAEETIRNYLKEMWDASDRIALKNKIKRIPNEEAMSGTKNG